MSINVLVIEESNRARKHIVRSLMEIGVSHVTEAADGDKAVNEFQQHQFDTILIDWNIRTSAAVELVKEIRKLDKDVPIILTGNQSDTQPALDANDPGPSDFLVKPFSNEILRRKLDKYTSAS